MDSTLKYLPSWPGTKTDVFGDLGQLYVNKTGFRIHATGERHHPPGLQLGTVSRASPQSVAVTLRHHALPHIIVGVRNTAPLL